MQVLAKWRSILIIKNTIIQSVTATPSINHLALFHSTNASFEKWKSKFNFEDVKGGDKQPPSKDYIRYSVRQKRSDTKKAVKDLLFSYNGSSRSSPSRFEDSCSKIEADMNKKSRLKPPRQAKKAHHKKMKSKHKREKVYEDFDEHERIFHAKFGEQYFTWSNSKAWQKGFDRRGTYTFEEENPSRNGVEFNPIIGTCSDRRTLGLPLAGALKIEDVKAAFRVSALKWHPDKHQGSLQGEAEEKFKLCVNAYNSLCSALSQSP